MTGPVHIILLGRNALIREGLRHILSQERFQVLHSVEDAADLGQADCREGSTIMIVIDQGSSDGGDDQLRDLQARFPGARLVVLAEAFDFENMARAFRSGVDGYIVKDIGCASLINSLQLVALGEKVLPGALASRLPSSPPAPIASARLDKELCDLLSGREIEILRCLVIGYPNKLISRRLDISEATVKVHVKAILRKLNVHNRTQAAIHALSRGIDGSSMDAGVDTRPEPMTRPFVAVPSAAAVAVANAVAA